MKKTGSKRIGFAMGIMLSILSFIFIVISLSLALSIQNSSAVYKTNIFNSFVLLILFTLALIGVLLQKFYSKFSDDIYIKIAIPIFGISSCLYSLFFIFDIKMGGISVDNNTNFICLLFFAVYTYIHSGFLCDWWEKQKDSIKKYIILILMEVPNVISWWVLAFSSPMNYVENINSPGHFWMTLFFALAVVFSLTGLRLYKASKQKAIIINDSL